MPIMLLVIILGIVEGLTEYLPVSSTGHLILATELLGFQADKWALFNVAIQPGAILAIVVLYWRTFRDVLVGLFQRDRNALRFTRNLLIAFFPAVVLGVALGPIITDCFSVTPATISSGRSTAGEGETLIHRSMTMIAMPPMTSAQPTTTAFSSSASMMSPSASPSTTAGVKAISRLRVKRRALRSRRNSPTSTSRKVRQ